jgi:hypothetical protein
MSIEMKYPFEFKELLITDKVLDVLGFSEYWAGSGEFGERSFGIQGVKLYRIVEQDEMDDPASGYGYGEPEYSSCHFSQPFASKKMGSIYFLHELYESIAEITPDLLEMFIEKTKQKGVNMYPYIKSYLEFIESKNPQK